MGCYKVQESLRKAFPDLIFIQDAGLGKPARQ
jgi:hypothetical protein